MLYLILIVAVIIVAVIFINMYKVRYDTVIAFTGGLGSGKSLLSVQYAIKLLRKNRRLVRRHNFLHRKDKWETPLLYSSIPLRISKKEYAVKLTEDHLLLHERVKQRSVVFIDEIGSFASQFDYKEKNIINNFNEFVRLFRHYTKGGYIICNDQCSENIVLEIRRRMNTVFNLMHFKKYFNLFYTVKVRNISISEEIKTIEENDTEDNMTTLFGVIPVFKRYDTYCYSERYNTVPQRDEKSFKKLKTNRLIKTPKEHKQPDTDNAED